MAALPDADALTVLVIDAPPTFEERVRAALPELPVLVMGRSAALLRRGPRHLVVLYESGPLDDRRLAEFASVGHTVVVAERGHSAEAVMSLDAGADGYLDATIEGGALRSALLGVARGEVAFGREPFGTWLGSRHPRPSASLTPRQRQIIDLIATGASDKEIAAAIGIRTSTVQKHVTRLLRKLGVRNRAAAVAVHRRSAVRTRIAS